MSSRDCGDSCSVEKKGGTEPVARSMVSIETGWKPMMRERAVGVRVAGEEMAAEPVPVRRPGVRVTGVEVLADGSGSSRVSHTGSTNNGSNLF